MLETIILSVTAFIGTNVDDLFLDMLLFSQAETKRERVHVLGGKYLGIGMLVLISLLGAFGLRALPPQYIRFLGLVPVALGIKALIEHENSDSGEMPEQEYENRANLLFHTAMITIASGADNIGVYIPLLTGFGFGQVMIMMVVFVLMIRLWCLLSRQLTDLPVIRRFLNKNRRILVPAVYIVLGIYILVN